jgi:hypothetical protein
MKYAYHRAQALCFSRGDFYSKLYGRIDSAGSNIRTGDLITADHNLFLAKLDLERVSKSKLIPPSTAKHISKLLDNPIEGVKKAMETRKLGKIGRVDRNRVHQALTAIRKASDRAYNKCSRGLV